MGWQSRWVLFDVLLVLGGYLELALQYMEWTGVDNLVSLGAPIKTLRLLRLTRVLRVYSLFETLWVLVNGLMQTLITLVWTAVTAFGFIVVFALVGMEMIEGDAIPHSGNFNN